MISAAPRVSTTQQAISWASNSASSERSNTAPSGASRSGRGINSSDSISRLGRKAEEISVRYDFALAPAVILTHKLPYRERIKKLVGEDEGWRIDGNMPELRMPLGPGKCHGALLHVAQNRTDLDQIDTRGVQEFRANAHGAQYVRHQRATSRAKFDKPDRLRLAAILPKFHKEQPDQFAENLTDFRGRDEIARYRLPPDVVTGLRIAECNPHIIGNADGALRRNHPANFADAVIHVDALLRRWLSAYQNSTAAAIHMGRLRA